MYTILSIQTDLAFLVLVMSYYVSNPNLSHWQVVKWIFRYFCSILSLQLTYHGIFLKLE